MLLFPVLLLALPALAVAASRLQGTHVRPSELLRVLNFATDRTTPPCSGAAAALDLHTELGLRALAC